MSRPLRSNFEPGSTRWAVRHAQWSAMGIAEADFEKPKIAIVNTSSGLSVCFQHLDGIARRVAAAACRWRSAPRRRRISSPAPAARGAT